MRVPRVPARRYSSDMEYVIRSIVIGAGATLTIDVWAALLRRFGIASLNFALLGRWVGHLPRGRFVHDSIARAAPIAGERALGWATHYAIGVSFAGALIAIVGLKWARAPTLLPALILGVVTVAAPLLVLQPALGAGVASRRTPAPLFNSLKSLATHTVFGLGLYLTARAIAP